MKIIAVMLFCTAILLAGCAGKEQGTAPVPPPPPPAEDGISPGPQDLQQHTFLSGDFLGSYCVVPGRQTLIFSSRHATKDYNIYMKEASGNRTIQLTSDEFDEGFPALSPDGDTLLFSSNRSGRWAMCIMSISGKANKFKEIISFKQADVIAPAWSPDGTKISFCVSDEQNGGWKICYIDIIEFLDDKPQIVMTGAAGLFPKWHPSNDRQVLLFQRPSVGEDGWYGLYLYDVATERVTEIVADERWAAIDSCWSPDGKMIYFASVNKSGTAKEIGAVQKADDLWACDAETGALYQMTSDVAAEWLPVANTDRIYFIMDKNGSVNIWSRKR